MPLDAARAAFGWLLVGPKPLSLDGRRFPGLPERLVPLDEVRQQLLRRRCPQPLRDAVWAHLVGHARADGGAWTVGCVGVALPALTGIAAKLTSRFVGDVRDIHAAVLTGFLSELPVIDLSRPRIMLRLRWAAYRSGHICLRESLDAPAPSAQAFDSAAPPPPAGHPDLVMARAVAARVITAAEAELIGGTRLEEVPLAEAAAQRGTGYEAAKKARQRAERRLVDFVREQLTEPGVDEPAARTDHQQADARGSRRVSAEWASGTRRRRIRRRVSPQMPHSGVQVRRGNQNVDSPADTEPPQSPARPSRRPAGSASARYTRRPVEEASEVPQRSSEVPRCA